MDIAGIATLTFFATLIGTVTGFGTSTMMVPVLLFFFDPLETLLFVGIIHLFGDIWKMVLFRTGIAWKLLIFFGIPGIFFSYLGSSLTLSVPSAFLTQLVGVFLLISVILLLSSKTVRIPSTPTAALIGGSLSGFIAGLSGIGGAVRGAFLSAFKLKKEVYLFTAGAIAFVIDVTRIGTYALGGTVIEQVPLWSFLLFIPISLMGALVAKRLLRFVPERQFSFLIAVALFLVSLKFIFWS